MRFIEEVYVLKAVKCKK